jgi:hypothetical protein
MLTLPSLDYAYSGKTTPTSFAYRSQAAARVLSLSGIALDKSFADLVK